MGAQTTQKSARNLRRTGAQTQGTNSSAPTSTALPGTVTGEGGGASNFSSTPVVAATAGAAGAVGATNKAGAAVAPSPVVPPALGANPAGAAGVQAGNRSSLNMSGQDAVASGTVQRSGIGLSPSMPGLMQTGPGGASIEKHVDDKYDPEAAGGSAEGGQSELDKLYDDFFSERAERRGSLEESNAFQMKMMEREALAQAGRTNRLLTGGGGAGLWAQAQIMGQHMAQNRLMDFDERTDMMALDRLQQKAADARHDEQMEAQAYGALASLPGEQLLQAAQGGNVMAQQVADDLGLDWQNISAKPSGTAATGEGNEGEAETGPEGAEQRISSAVARMGSILNRLGIENSMTEVTGNLNKIIADLVQSGMSELEARTAAKRYLQNNWG